MYKEKLSQAPGFFKRQKGIRGIGEARVSQRLSNGQNCGYSPNLFNFFRQLADLMPFLVSSQICGKFFDDGLLLPAFFFVDVDLELEQGRDVALLFESPTVVEC